MTRDTVRHERILAAIQAIDAASRDAMTALFSEPDATRAAYEVSKILAVGHSRAQDLLLAAIWQRTPDQTAVKLPSN